MSPEGKWSSQSGRRRKGAPEAAGGPAEAEVGENNRYEL